jgi:hypothetical protein
LDDWDNVCEKAAQAGHLNCNENENEECKWVNGKCSIAVKNGQNSPHFECLKYAYTQNGCDWNIGDICYNAVENGCLDHLKYAHENGYEWDWLTCCVAAENGHLDCLQYAHENGCEWNKSTCTAAARYGHLDCLQYAHENGCEWNESTCAAAAEGGHLDCLRYAHENGCKWNKKTSYIAANNNHINCLKYAYDNGCEFYTKTVKYLKAHIADFIPRKDSKLDDVTINAVKEAIACFKPDDDNVVKRIDFEEHLKSTNPNIELENKKQCIWNAVKTLGNSKWIYK